MNLADDLLDLINSELSLDPATVIEMETDLLLTGLVDSLGVVEIVAWLEDRLGMEIDPMDVVIENFRTVEAMVIFASRTSV